MTTTPSTSAGTIELPLLTKSNYHEWSLVMQVCLEAMGLWGAVESSKAQRREDRLALAAILRGVLSDMKIVLAMKETAKEAWDSVKLMRVGDAHVKSANVERLLKEFENIAFRDGESVDDFVMRINGLVGNLRKLGEAIEDSRVVKKILRVLLKTMKQVAISIQMLMDLNTLSVEDLLGRLRVAEEQDDVEEEAEGAQRVLLVEERREKYQTQSGDWYNFCVAGRRSDDDVRSTSSGASRRQRGRCFNCGERGHIAKFCPENKKEKALVADVDVGLTLM
ncbi:hypothetical protein ACP4OV_002981 [Aristida adscensionis]